MLESWDMVTRSKPTEIHSRRNRALSDTVGTIHIVGPVLKLTMPVNSGAIG